MHNRESKKEWSGILLYSHREGDISDADDLVLVAEDLYPMDIGTSGSTQYENDADSIVDMIEMYPGIEEGRLKMGHVHSHHSMDAYFSSTDMSELQDNAPSHNYYLSLIVNFAFEPVAKIATVCEFKQGVIAHKGANDVVEKPVEEEKRLGIYDVTVTQDLDQQFYDRYSKVKKQAKKRKKAATRKIGYTTPYGYGYGRRSGWHGRNKRQYQQPYGGQYPYNYPTNQTRMGLGDTNFDDDDLMEDFISRWINLNPNTQLAGGIDAAINQLEIIYETSEGDEFSEYLDTLSSSFETMADSILAGGMRLTDDEYLKVIKISIDILEAYEGDDLIDEVLEELELIKENYEETVKQ